MTSPLNALVLVSQGSDAILQNLLMDAAADAAARMLALGKKPGIGAQVRRAQYAQVRAEMLKTSAGLYGAAGTNLVTGVQQAGEAAAKAAADMDAVIFQNFGQTLPPGLAAAHREQAKHTVKNYQARTANGIPLSSQVYKTQALSQGIVDAQINQAILLGESWKELADRVKGSIRPDVKGGVAYAAQRLGRTEINNAFHTVQQQAHQDEPWVHGMRWNLSRSHPVADDCDAFAKETHYQGGKPGVYEKGSVPKKPHPQCLCYLTAEAVSEDDFVNGFLNGNYDRYLDEKVYGHAPRRERPC